MKKRREERKQARAKAKGWDLVLAPMFVNIVELCFNIIYMAGLFNL